MEIFKSREHYGRLGRGNEDDLQPRIRSPLGSGDLRPKRRRADLGRHTGDRDGGGCARLGTHDSSSSDSFRDDDGDSRAVHGHGHARFAGKAFGLGVRERENHASLKSG